MPGEAKAEGAKPKESTVHDKIDRLITVAETSDLEEMKSNIETLLSRDMFPLMEKYSQGEALDPEENKRLDALGKVADRLGKIDTELSHRGEAKAEADKETAETEGATQKVGEQTLGSINALRRLQGRNEYADFDTLYDEAARENERRPSQIKLKQEREAEESAREYLRDKEIHTEREHNFDLRLEEQACKILESQLDTIDEALRSTEDWLAERKGQKYWEKQISIVRGLREDLIAETKNFLAESASLSEEYTEILATERATKISELWGADTDPSLFPIEEDLTRLRVGLLAVEEEYQGKAKIIMEKLRKKGVGDGVFQVKKGEVDISVSTTADTADEKLFWLHESSSLESEEVFMEARDSVEDAVEKGILTEKKAEEVLSKLKDRILATRLQIKRIQKRIDEENSKPFSERNYGTLLLTMKMLEREVRRLNEYRNELLISIDKEDMMSKIRKALKI